jgi:hypothetical protein
VLAVLLTAAGAVAAVFLRRRRQLRTSQALRA